MIKKIRLWMTAFMFVGVLGGSFMTVAAPQPASAAGCTDRVLGMPTWYRGLGKSEGGGCEIKSPGTGEDGLSRFIWKIVLNIIEIALVLVGYISVGFIIYGGFKYITGAGSSSQMASGKTIILNAVVGLVISLLSIGIVNIIFAGFSGTGGL